MSTFWSIWVIVLTLITVVGSLWLLFANRKIEVKGDSKPGEPTKTGHTYDGIEEYDNPLPGWWFNMFVATVIFTVIYLVLYPGFGSFQGLLGWSQEQQWQDEVDAAEERYGPVFARYADTAVEELSLDPEAMKMAGRLFANNCSTCHGADGRGAYGFPNLADDAWLYGGSPAAIKTSIEKGRNGMMTPWESVIPEDDINNVANYVLSLSGRSHGETAAEKGQGVFNSYCAACHNTDGTGNQMLGAPNLTDRAWLYSGSLESIRQIIRQGRQGNMPAHEALLKADKIHFLTAYVYGLKETQ